MMKRGLLITIGLLFLISFVSAELTPVHVKTLPWHEVQITAFDANAAGFTALDRIILTADRYGDVSWNASVDTEFNLIVYIKYRGESITDKKFLNEYEPGEEVSITVAPAGAELIETPETNVVIEEVVVNEILENETEELTEITPESGSSLTGYAIFGEGGWLSSKTIYYIVGGVIGLIIILLIVWFILTRKKAEGESSPKEIKITKLSELKAQQEANAIKDEELMKAEEELKIAQAKISAIKNKDRISELQNEIEERKRELERLGFKSQKEKVYQQTLVQQKKPAWQSEEGKE